MSNSVLMGVMPRAVLWTGALLLWSFPISARGRCFRVGEKPVVGLTWSPDSDEFAYGTREGELGIYHVKERKSRVLYRLEKGRVMDLSWDPLGDRIAVATATGAVLLVEVASGKGDPDSSGDF